MPMNTLTEDIVRAYDATRSFHQKAFRSACYAPFTTLEFNVKGEVIACWKSAKYVLGRIGEQTLDEIWNGPRIQAMREHLRNYDFPESCKWCAWQLQAGDFGEVLTKRYDVIEVGEGPLWPRQFYFNLGNECNFACVMCCGDASSTIRARIEGRPPKPQVYTEAFHEQLEKYLPHLKFASFFGGEPFLVPGHYRVWDRLIAIGSQAVIHINTNGSVLNDRVRYYLDALSIGTIAVSIDGASQQMFEAIRRFSNFEHVMANLEYFAQFCRERNKSLHIVVCVLRQNYHELPQIYALGQRLGGWVTLNMVTHPPEYSVYTLPEPERLRIRDALAAAFVEMEGTLSPRNRSSFQGLLRRLGAKESWEAGDREADEDVGGGPV